MFPFDIKRSRNRRAVSVCAHRFVHAGSRVLPTTLRYPQPCVARGCKLLNTTLRGDWSVTCIKDGMAGDSGVCGGGD